nr:transposase and inactivated derivatives [Bradyrhizobium sp. DOA9]
MRRREPTLSSEYRDGLLNKDGCHVSNVRAYYEALAKLILTRGGKCIHARACGFEANKGRLTKVFTDTGGISCTHAVVAAGIGSKRLAAAAGDYVSLKSERGYHVVFAKSGLINGPIMPLDGKMAITLRILNIVDDVTKECLGATPDTSISGRRMARELTTIVGRRRKPGMIVSDHGTEFTCNAMLGWCKEAAID